MKKIKSFLLMLIILPCAFLFCACNVQTTYHSPTITEEVVITSDLTQATNTAMMSTVAIFTETRNGYSAGAGVIYSLNKETSEAYIITNYHVVVNGDYFSGSPSTSTIYAQPYGSEYCTIGTTDFGSTTLIKGNNLLSCTYVGGSKTYDIAVLKVQDDLLKTYAVQAATISKSTAKLGSTVIAIGNPNFEGLSATRGTISVESEEITVCVSDETVPTANQEYISYRAIRFDAPINGGNSGGGLYNEKGELIGIASASGEELENYSSAIPITVAVNVAENILYGKEKDLNGLYKFNSGITFEAQNTQAIYEETTGLLFIKEDIIVTNSEGVLYTYGVRNGDKIVSVKKGEIEIELSRAYELEDFFLSVYPGDTFIITWASSDGNETEEITTSSSDYSIIA